MMHNDRNDKAYITSSDFDPTINEDYHSGDQEQV